ncbi:MAG: hypothetical protein EBT07_11180 [Actinobacteria bacterium]|nr:hypothetical protein [Actinomycetota bacterium]
MILLSFLLLIIIGAVTLPAAGLTKKYKPLRKWDYIYPFTGVLFSFVLFALRIGQPATLTNYVYEGFYITTVSAVVPWMIFFAFKFNLIKNRIVLRALTLLPIIFTSALRLLMKTLPV